MAQLTLPALFIKNNRRPQAALLYNKSPRNRGDLFFLLTFFFDAVNSFEQRDGDCHAQTDTGCYADHAGRLERVV